MKLSEVIEIKHEDIVSITGAGGKTTFMFELAEELRNSFKVLVTTTTKIYVPSFNNYNFLCTKETELSKYAVMSGKGTYVFGKDIIEANKIVGFDEETLRSICQHFDYSIIESDGAKKKPLKGWKDSEPVIYSKTTKTVGILDISMTNQPISETIVHRSERFCSIAKAALGESLTIDHLKRVVTSPQGLFKNSVGEQILFINKVEKDCLINEAEILTEKIKLLPGNNITKIIAGSLKHKDYRLLWERKGKHA